MVDTPSLARSGSVVPVACHQVDSAVIHVATDKAWESFKGFHLEKINPERFASVQWTHGTAGAVDSVARVTYTDGAVWDIVISEVSNLRHTISYNVIAAEPALGFTSLQGSIVLRPVTLDNHTLVEWHTDVSNDADAAVIQDQHFKKLDFFRALQTRFA